MSKDADAEKVQSAFISVVRALGLLRPDTTPCGQAMSTTEAHALGELHAVGPITQQQLAVALRLQKSTVSRLVDQLTQCGLCQRAANPADRRSFLIELTTKGTTRARRLEHARRDLFERLLTQLSAAERRSVIVGIAQLEQAVRALNR